MVKRLVRARSLSVRLLYSHFSALKAVKPVNPVLPSCSGAEQRHADSCIWQDRGLSITVGIVQAETPPPPLQSSLFQLPCSFPARQLPKEQPHCGYETQRLLPLHRGNLVPSAPCQAQLTDPFHTRLMLLHAE